mgnify:CR=1 FL=1
MKENKMGVMSVRKLVITMSLPMMISMLVQAFYNFVDSVFVGYISENALTAVSLAFPVQNLMIAVATGTGVGMNALLSMRLGQKNSKAVNETAMNGLFLSVCSAIVFVILGFTIPEFYFKSQTSDLEIIDYYLSKIEDEVEEKTPEITQFCEYIESSIDNINYNMLKAKLEEVKSALPDDIQQMIDMYK